MSTGSAGAPESIRPIRSNQILSILSVAVKNDDAKPLAPGAQLFYHNRVRQLGAAPRTAPNPPPAQRHRQIKIRIWRIRFRDGNGPSVISQNAFDDGMTRLLLQRGGPSGASVSASAPCRAPAGLISRPAWDTEKWCTKCSA